MGQQHSTDAWLLYFKSRFLGADDVKLPNGEVVVRPFSSSELDTKEFSEFMDKVEAWCAQRGVYLQDENAA